MPFGSRCSADIGTFDKRPVGRSHPTDVVAFAGAIGVRGTPPAHGLIHRFGCRVRGIASAFAIVNRYTTRQSCASAVFPRCVSMERIRKMKRVLTIQDISCLGKCSLTIALPVISALGSETVILPTALLSTYTMFQNFTCKDLSDQMEPIAAHWESENVAFDAIYTGYFGTVEQIDQVKSLFRRFRRENTMIVVDPVMADNGKLYPAFDMEYVKKNATLCAEADIIVPNITEAALMTGLAYREEYDVDYLKNLLAALDQLGAKVSVLTGVSLEKGKTGVMGYDHETGEYYIHQNRRIDAVYHGTGDLFSSTCVGEMMKGKDWRDAMRIAADYTAHTIEVTLQNADKPWYGVDFEATIPELTQWA